MTLQRIKNIMKYGSLVLEKHDFLMTKKFMELNVFLEDYMHKNALEILDKNLENALILQTETMPSDIVRLDSKVIVTNPLGWREQFELVSPDEANPKENKISVTSSLGASIIGRSEGDFVEFGIPGNMMMLRLEKVEQSGRRTMLAVSESELKKLFKRNPDSFLANELDS